jgi:hypothetical protein
MKPVILPKIFQPYYCENLVRLGKDNDGGYLVNKSDIEKSKKLISFGIKDDWSFEEDFIKINDCAIDAYDGTINADDEVKLKTFFGGNKIYIPKNIGNKQNQISFDSTISEDCFLKCDIEGSEYDILDDIIINTKKLTGIVIEFHDIQYYDQFNLITNFIGKIDQKLVHVHINNCSYAESDKGCIPYVVELTFTSSQNIEWKEVKLPHVLDMPNCAERDDFRIMF